MKAERETALITGIGLIAFAVALAMFAFSVTRGLGLTDEALTVYLLLHPDAPMASMDHFLVGHLLRLMPWTVVGLRWFAILLSVVTPVILALSVVRWISRFVVFDWSPRLIFVTFSLLGGLFCFTAIRPLPNYAFNLVIGCDIFAAVYFATGARSWPSAVAMGCLAGLVFLARAPVFPFLFVFLAAAAWVEGRSVLGSDNLKRCVRILAVTAAFVAMLVAGGLDITTQLHLMRVLATTSHRPGEVIIRDLGYGAAIIAIAALAAFGAFVQRRAANERRHDGLLVASSIVLSVAATGYMLWLGFATFSNPTSSLLAGNDAPRSLGPAIHVVVMSLLAVYGVWKPGGAVLLKPCLLLYLLCLLPQIGSNTGIWHRTTANMAPLFLIVAIILFEGVRHAMISRAALPPVAAAITPPLIVALFASMVAHPMAIQGSAMAQTVPLDHPRVLRGVKVTPPAAALQAHIESQLARLHFDPMRESLLPGTSRIGLVVLAGANALGNGWYFSNYSGSERWNCAVMDLWLAHAPRRVIAIDPDTLRTTTGTCLARYAIPAQTGSLGEVSILRPRS